MPLSYSKHFSAMEWVLSMDELAAWQSGRPYFGRSAEEKPGFIKQNSSVEHLPDTRVRG